MLKIENIKKNYLRCKFALNYLYVFCCINN